jgi:beta-1,4-mannosyltransferase
MGRFVRFVCLLLLLRARGACLTWTAHNLMPHQRALIPLVDVLARHIIIALSEAIFAHSQRAAALIAQRFPAAAGKLHIIPHGNWIGHYRRLGTRAEARDRLKLTRQAYVLLFFGACRPYKNLEALVAAFRRVPDNDLRLVIAGDFQDAAYRDCVQALAGHDVRIGFDSRFIPDDELSTYLEAADVVVVPYRDVLTSGSVMLAFSFGRPVISVARGFLLDVVTPESGVLFEPNSVEELVEAIARVRARTYRESYILEHARQFRFEDAAQTFLEVLRSINREPKKAPVQRST